MGMSASLPYQPPAAQRSFRSDEPRSGCGICDRKAARRYYFHCMNGTPTIDNLLRAVRYLVARGHEAYREEGIKGDLWRLDGHLVTDIDVVDAAYRAGMDETDPSGLQH